MIKIERMFQTGPLRIRCFGFSYNLRFIWPRFLSDFEFGFRILIRVSWEKLWMERKYFWLKIIR